MGVCFNAGGVLAEVIGDVDGVWFQIVDLVDQLQGLGFSAVVCCN